MAAMCSGRAASSCVLVVLAVLMAAQLHSAAAKAPVKWRKGDSTWYPAIDAGSCGYGNVKGLPTGRFIAAVSDKVKGYKEMCGQCYEVKCDTRVVKDHFGGSYYGAPYACKKKGKSIIVMVTDECTCIGNNKWCCDSKFTHLDLSKDAYWALADNTKSGVMAINFRRVPCPAGKGKAKSKGRKSSGNRRQKARSCKQMVGPWQQCGGKSTNVWAQAQDKPWDTHCCREHLECKRKSEFYWDCVRGE